MSKLKPVRLLGAAALLSLSGLAAIAQQAPPPSPPAEKPPMTKPEPAPGPQTAPAPSQQKPGTPPKSSQAPATHPLVGLSAFSSDGSKVGDVRTVNTAADGKLILHIRTGGFLGFGGRIVAVSENRFTKNGQNIQLGLTSDEVSKLPAVKDES